MAIARPRSPHTLRSADVRRRPSLAVSPRRAGVSAPHILPSVCIHACSDGARSDRTPQVRICVRQGYPHAAGQRHASVSLPHDGVRASHAPRRCAGEPLYRRRMVARAQRHERRARLPTPGTVGRHKVTQFALHAHRRLWHGYLSVGFSHRRIVAQAIALSQEPRIRYHDGHRAVKDARRQWVYPKIVRRGLRLTSHGKRRRLKSRGWRIWRHFSVRGVPCDVSRRPSRIHHHNLGAHPSSIRAMSFSIARATPLMARRAGYGESRDLIICKRGQAPMVCPHRAL